MLSPPRIAGGPFEDRKKEELPGSSFQEKKPKSPKGPSTPTNTKEIAGGLLKSINKHPRRWAVQVEWVRGFVFHWREGWGQPGLPGAGLRRARHCFPPKEKRAREREREGGMGGGWGQSGLPGAGLRRPFGPPLLPAQRKEGEPEGGRGELDTATVLEVSTRGTLRSVLWQLWLADKLIL